MSQGPPTLIINETLLMKAGDKVSKKSKILKEATEIIYT